MISHRLAPALAGMGAVVAVVVATATPSAAAMARTATIAMIASVDYRASVIAQKTSDRPAATARVTVEVSTRSGNSWAPVHARSLPGVYFWNTVSGPHSVCRLEIKTAGGAVNRPQLLVQLLVSQATGCGRAHAIPLPG